MRVLPAAFAMFPTLLWAEDIPVTSAVSAVTMYPYGATIIRQAEFSVPAGNHRLVLGDLPESTPLESIRVEIEGAVMGGLTMRDDYIPPHDNAKTPAVEAAEDEVERLEIKLSGAQSDIQAIRLEADAAQARVDFLRQLGKGEAVTEMDVTALRDLSSMIGEETLAALRAAHDANIRVEAANRDLKDIVEELDRARQALRALVPEEQERALLVASVTAPSDVEGVMTISYNVQDAEWSPVYDLKLDRESGKLGIERGAYVWQGTGEHWTDVALTLSTTRPSEQADPSTIWSDLRRIFDPELLEPKTLVRARPEAGAADYAEVAAASMEEPSIVPISAIAEFDGLSVTYNYPDKVSIADDADVLRIALGSLETQSTLSALAVPLSDSSAFLMADFTNDTGELILPTSEASFYLDGRFIGTKSLELIPAGAEADLSFGPIEGLRLTRTVLDRREGDRGVISKSNELSERTRIEIENLTGQAWALRVLDRVPYSEQDDLAIDWQANPSPSEQDVDGKRGVLAWEMDLPADKTQIITLTHEIEWPEGMMLR